MKVPFVDLRAQYDSIKSEIDHSIKSVINDTAFIGGKYVDVFAKNFAELYGVKYCVPVANGTDAIYIALKMLGVGIGDEIITAANSWISTSETITQTGARPVFVDINEYYTIDVNQIRSKITSKTKAIIPVHLTGQSADMDPILQIADEFGLYVIEDSAQAHFSEYKGKRTGTMGSVGTFSFYPGKNLGAYGDAGCIITNDDNLAKKMKAFANHGALIKHQHQMEGINSRLDGLQAAILSVKLSHILKWTEKRIQAASWYFHFFAQAGLEEVLMPKILNDTVHTFHLFMIQVQHRSELMASLKEKGIATAIHYPTPLPFMEAYSYLRAEPKGFPVAADNMNKILSLPIYPEISIDQVEYVVDSIKSFYGSLK